MHEQMGYFQKHHDNRGTNLEIAVNEVITSVYNNSEGPVSRVELSMISNGAVRELKNNYILKVIKCNLRSTCYPSAAPENVLEKHDWLKKNGIPVVPTLRADHANGRLIMTDMSEQGKKRVVDRHNPFSMLQFPSNEKEIVAELESIAEQSFANGDGVFLSRDAYSIILDRNNIGKVCILDIGLGSEKLRNFKDYSGMNYSLERANIEVSAFVRNVGIMR